jgi:type IV secretory pathway VirB10-like protein
VDVPGQPPTNDLPQQETSPEQHQRAWYLRWWAIAGAAVLVLTVIAALAGGGSRQSPTPAATGAGEARDATEQAPRTTRAQPTPEPSPEPEPEPSPEEPAPEPEPTAEPESVPEPEPEPVLSPDQENALRTAQDYLAYTSFSRQGLVEQLVYEGFTPEQAEYGASRAYDG